MSFKEPVEERSETTCETDFMVCITCATIMRNGGDGIDRNAT